jgi:hypothetical protein
MEKKPNRTSIGPVTASLVGVYFLALMSSATRSPSDSLNTPTPDEIRLAAYFDALKARGPCHLARDGTGDVSVYAYDHPKKDPNPEYTGTRVINGSTTAVVNHVTGDWTDLTIQVNNDTCVVYQTISRNSQTGTVDKKAIGIYMHADLFRRAVRGGARPHVPPQQYMQAPNP